MHGAAGHNCVAGKAPPSRSDRGPQGPRERVGRGSLHGVGTCCRGCPSILLSDRGAGIQLWNSRRVRRTPEGRCSTGRLDDSVFLVDGANYLGPVLDEDEYRFQVISNGNRSAIERVFCEIERRTSLFANSFNPCRVVDSRIVAASPCRPAQLMPKLTRPTHYGAHIHHTNGGAEGDS